MRTRKENYGNQTQATDFSGEIGIELGYTAVKSKIDQCVNPYVFVIGGMNKLVKQIFTIRKDKKKIIFVVILSVVWIVLDILIQLGIDPKPVKLLSFLTFAQGGVSDNPFRVTGGIVGKAIYTYFLTSLIMPVFKGKNPLKNVFDGIKNMKSEAKDILSKAIPMFLGAGIALGAYNFFAGYASLEKSMVAVAASLLTIKEAGSSTGFLTGFFSSVYRKAKNKTVSDKHIIQILGGMSLGFACSIPLSTLPFGFICYAAGVLMLVVSFVLSVVKKKKMEGKII